MSLRYIAFRFGCILLLCLFTQYATLAQEQYCGHNEERPHAVAPSEAARMAGMTPSIPSSGNFKALVVFFRFNDDTAVDNGCVQAKQEWSQPDDLPDIADYILSQSSNPPFDERSLTSYYYEQSDGNFTLYGDVYPEVVVTTQNESAYTFASRALTEDILDQLDADVNFDFSDYDDNSDGYVDHIFLVPRASTSPGYSGISRLGLGADLTYDNTDINLDFSGSYNRYNDAGNIIPELTLTRLMAHEIGHDLWTNSTQNGAHLYALQGGDDVPSNGSDRHGYALMVGAHFSPEVTIDTRGDMTISAYERLIMQTSSGNEWITCSTLSSNTSVTLTDLLSTGACRTIDIPSTGSTPARTLFLSNRQRIDFFDELQYDACLDGDYGLMTTGLLVTVAQEGTGGDFPRFGVIAADDDLALSTDKDVYEGDLFDSGELTQLTPWTRPNISGYTEYPSGFSMQTGNWQAIDDIQKSGNNMEFDYIADFRTDPVIREDSWIGAETDGETISGDLIVQAGATLTIEPGTTLEFASGTGITVYGTLIMDDVTLTASSTTWDGIYISGAEGVSITDSNIENATTGIYAQNMNNLYIDGTTITGSTSDAFRGSSLSGSEIYDTVFEDSGRHGVYITSGGLRLIDCRIENNDDHGIILTSASIYLGGGGDPGNNVVTGNGWRGLFSYNSSADLGYYITPGDLYAGYNSIYGNTGEDIYAIGSSTIRAEENWWGESPPNTSDFHTDGSSSLDYTPWLTSDPNPSSPLAKLTTASQDVSSNLSSAGQEQFASPYDNKEQIDDFDKQSIGEFVRYVQALRDEQGRAYISAMLGKIADKPDHPMATVAQVLRLGDLLFLKQPQEVVKIGERLLERRRELHVEVQKIVGRALLTAYWEQLEDEVNAARIKGLLIYLGDVDVISGTLASGVEATPFFDGKEDGKVVAGSVDETLDASSYPNPFNPATTIRYKLPTASHVVLKVYDVLGREVSTLVNGVQQAGAQEAVFEATDLPSGTYLYRLEAAGTVQTGRMLLLK